MKNPTSDSARLETRLRSFFGLKSLPFTKDLEPDKPFSTDTFARGLDRLHYLADRQGTGVVYGTPGTGKSTLLRSFLASLPRTSHAVCYVARTNCAAVELFREIARGFQVAPSYRKADVLREIHDRVLKLSRTQKVRPVLVVDEAHLLPSAVLDELRLLTSFEEDSRDDLTFVIAGHPQLESNLRLAVHEAFAQRIVLRVHLRPFNATEVAEYLTFRLQLAGRSARLFLPDAVEAIHRASRGVPRLVDRLAEHSLLLSLRAKRSEIDADVVTEAIDEVEL
jgi:type II secretory pathway predicted ATPase ExeA